MIAKAAASGRTAAARSIPPDATEDGTDPRRWRALLVTQLAAFMVLLDVSIVNVSARTTCDPVLPVSTCEILTVFRAVLHHKRFCP
jgi:hypothetical protein